MAVTLDGKPVHELSVIELAGAVASGALTPAEIARALLERIDALDGRVMAFSYLDRDDVRRQAEELTAEAKAGRLRGPLHGVPVAIKDEFNVQGQPTGMRGEGAPPEPEDATPVARLRAAGAIIMGKTHMPVGDRTPPTRNPWNLEHTPGGSSSGSGAAVGARMAPVALGEQTVGSNLRPAAYCGISALKPTYGRVSRYGCYPFTWTLDHPGIIGLNMADIALVLSVIAGPDPKDPTTLPDAPPPAAITPLGRPPRIGLVRNFFPERTQPETNQAIQAAAERLRNDGAEVLDFRLPEEFGLSWHVAKIINGVESATFYAKQLSSPWARVARATPAAGTASINRTLASLIPAPYYLQSLRIKKWLGAKVAAAIEGIDALLLPVAPGPAPKTSTDTGDPTLLSPFTMLGWPALALPIGFASNGLPLGVQIVSPAGSDEHLLRVGAWCEGVWGLLPVPELE